MNEQGFSVFEDSDDDVVDGVFVVGVITEGVERVVVVFIGVIVVLLANSTNGLNVATVDDTFATVAGFVFVIVVVDVVVVVVIVGAGDFVGSLIS